VKIDVIIGYTFLHHSLSLGIDFTEDLLLEKRVFKLKPSEARQHLLVDIQCLVVVTLIIFPIAFDFGIICDENKVPNVSDLSQLIEHIVFKEESLL
jgi:hypothetical protein